MSTLRYGEGDSLTVYDDVQPVLQKHSDCPLFAVANEDGVALGKKTMDQVRFEYRRTLDQIPELLNSFIHLSHPDSQTPSLRKNSLSRMPNIGMLHYIEKECESQYIHVDWARSIFVGEGEVDMVFAERAAMQFMPASDFFGRK
ncbi:MAG: hypothetical protein JNJ94_00220 [Chlorobi bacterium]|nr:hypothetical protein [Chlorobiota bacterium]